mmetsp:Transcript_2456/g.4931  ORF Transcript_2456/g.4931 Transcript_2456/m.4931 type:complete len:166 (+) Transcript_2456:876-1373(+)
MIKLVPSEGAALGTSVGLTEGMVVGALLGAGETVGARDGVSLGAAVGGSVFRMHRLLHEDLAVVNTSIRVLRDIKTPSIRIRNCTKYTTRRNTTRHPARRSRTTMHCGAVCHARTVSIRFDCIRFQLFIDALPRRDKTATRQQLYGELLWRDLQLNGTTRDQREA